jgi:hypothetical protein
MSRTRRLALTALSAVAVTSVGFITGATLIAASIGSPAAATGKGGGCGIGASQCRISQTDAFAAWFSGDPTILGPAAIINPTRGTFVMKPRGGPATITPLETVVTVQFSTPTINGFGCFVVPDSAFVVSRDLQSATLNATLNPNANACPGLMTPQLGAAQAGPVLGGIGAPGGGLPAMTVSVTWTGPGLAFHSTSSSTQACGGFTATFHTQGSSSQSNANGNLTFADGSTLALGSTLSAGVDDFNSIINSNGFPPAQCIAS